VVRGVRGERDGKLAIRLNTGAASAEPARRLAVMASRIDLKCMGAPFNADA
jgi:hypothetical protein